MTRAEPGDDAGPETAPFSPFLVEEEVTFPSGAQFDRRDSRVHTRISPSGRETRRRQTDAVQRASRGKAVPWSARPRGTASALGRPSGEHGQQVSVRSPRVTPADSWTLPSDLIVQRVATNGRPLVLASLPQEKWAAMERTLQGLADTVYYWSWNATPRAGDEWARPYRVPGTRPLFWFSGGGPAGLLLARQDGGTYVDDGRTVGSLIRAELRNLPPEERPWTIFVMSPGPGEDGAGLALLTVEHGHITGLTELPAAMSSGATAVTPSTDSLYPSELHLLPGADGRPTHWFTDDQAGGARLLPLRSGAPARNVTRTLPVPEHRFAVEDAPASARRLPATQPAIPRGMSEVFRGWGEFRYGRSADGSWWAGVFPSGQWAARSPWLERVSASVEFHSWTMGADGEPVGRAFRLVPEGARIAEGAQAPGGARPLLFAAHGGPASEAVASLGVRFAEWLVARGERVTHLLAAPCGDGSGLVPGAYREWAVRHRGTVFAAPEESAVGQGASRERAGWHNRPGSPGYLLRVGPEGRVSRFPERGVSGREASEVPLPAVELYNRDRDTYERGHRSAFLAEGLGVGWDGDRGAMLRAVDQLVEPEDRFDQPSPDQDALMAWGQAAGLADGPGVRETGRDPEDEWVLGWLSREAPLLGRGEMEDAPELTLPVRESAPAEFAALYGNREEWVRRAGLYERLLGSALVRDPEARAAEERALEALAALLRELDEANDGVPVGELFGDRERPERGAFVWAVLRHIGRLQEVTSGQPSGPDLSAESWTWLSERGYGVGSWEEALRPFFGVVFAAHRASGAAGGGPVAVRACGGGWCAGCRAVGCVPADAGARGVVGRLRAAGVG
ncbi:hypothetical protein ACWV95_20155 [Streptomyces albus]